VAAVLSFLWPGLGQLFQGRRRRAVVFALPLLPLVIAGLVFLADGLETAALRLFDPVLAQTVFWLIVLAAAWRLLALGEHVFEAGPRRMRRTELVIVLALSIIVLETHAIAGSYALAFYNAGQAIFDPGRPTPEPGSTPLPSGAPEPSPFETPATAQSRINVLLIGVDSSSARSHALTDTLIVASVDPVSGATSMVSFPRDIAEFPMYDGRTYYGKINSFANYAAARPRQFPDGGIPSLMREIGYLLGIPIHYYASVNLEGFVRVVDALGYVEVNNPREIADPRYGGWTDGRPIGFFLSKGVHRLDGAEALAYARSRMGAGDSDFTRAARQQQLLSAVRARVADPSLLPRLPAILEAIGQTIRTNFPPDRLSEMLLLARRVDDAATKRVVLGRPYSFHPPTNSTGGTYILRLRMERLKKLSVELYGQDSAYWTPGSSPLPSPGPSASPAS
jgi:LCP family protein required for cell wall assembly